MIVMARSRLQILNGCVFPLKNVGLAMAIQTIAAILLWCPILLRAQTGNERWFEVSATKYLMGTQVDVLAQHESIQSCKSAFYEAFREIDRIENLLSAQREASELARINQNAGQAPVKVSWETLAIIRRAVDYAKKFDGYFDISIGPISHLWGFGWEKKVAVPERRRLVALLPLVGYGKIIINAQDTTIAFGRDGMKLDLGGIAKGYAIDRAAMVLRRQGIKNFLLNADGDIYAAGHKSDNQKWHVGIQHPRGKQALIASFELSDFAVATSGDYERFIEVEGTRYHHIFDPRTGYPAPLTQSVSVLAPTAEEADAWATYLFIIGFEGYQKIFSPRTPLALFVDANDKIHWDAVWEKNYLLKFLD
jgi:thiamine biosynthesis lipoprotein